MEKGFLYQVAELFWKEAGDSISEYRFVFPNRRSSLFFQKYLGQIASKPLFSPNLITINTLFQEISGLRLADKTSSLFDLFTEYTLRGDNEKTAESFDDFLFWGDMILNDFDDVDKYLIDARKLFANIRDLHQLDSGYEFLSPEQRAAMEEFWGNFIPFSDQYKEKSFLSVWDRLFDIYTGFRKTLMDRGEGYEGMIYRAVAEEVAVMDTLPEALRQYKKIVFVGLNALNRCEKALLTFLKKEGVADFYWDYYGSVIKDRQNKSSLFMDENVRNYPSCFKLEDDFTGDARVIPQIEVIGVPSMVGQAKCVYNILDGLVSGSDDAISTAVVLPDENLLLPVINSIPRKIGKVNVTMGYSLVHNQVASFMDLISALHGRTRLNGSKISFYHTVVTDILSHPFITSIAEKISYNIKKEIIAQNMIYVPSEKLVGTPLLELIFAPLSNVSLDKSENVRCLADYQLSILLELQKSASAIDKEFIFAYYKCVNRLKGLNLPIETATYNKLLKQLVSSISIPFKGEPLSGLQIMGPLETRALDFDNVIILSVNEGTFPSRGVSTSFIPYNLRKGFDLPNYEYQDSISSYHFYRSIYRAKKVFLLYDTRTEGAGRSGEASRFVKQLKYHHNVPLKEHSVSFKIDSSGKDPITVPKTDGMIALLDNKHFSASSINSYISCSLKFYYQVVEGIREEDDVTDEVEYAMFGTLFHKVMEDFYSPYKGKVVTEEILNEAISDEESIKMMINKAFASEMKVYSIEGKNKIIEALILRYVKKTLEFDKKKVPFTLVNTEGNYVTKLYLPKAKKRVNLTGFIDRIDRKPDGINIIDYKTGGFNIIYNDIADIFDSSSANRPYTALQMLIYLILLKEGKVVAEVEDAVMSVCSVKELFRTVSPGFSVNAEQYEEFISSLTALVDEIFDISVPFKGTDDTEVCGKCPYNVICNR